MTETDYNKFWSPAFDDMRDLVCLIDCDDNLVKANGSFLKVFGGDEKKLIGKKGEFYEPGLKKYFSVTVTPIWSDDHKCIGSIHVAEDVTEHKGAQDEIEAAEDYTDTIMKSMIDALIVIDPDARIKTLNRAALEMLGYREEELIGRPVGMILEEEEEEEATPFKGTRFRKLLKSGFMTNYEMTWKGKSGNRIPVSFSGSAMRDRDGRLVGIVAVARDMREKKTAEDALKELGEKYRTVVKGKAKLTFFKEYAENVLANVPISILVVNRSHQIVYANKNFLTKMKMAEAGVIGHKLPEVMLPEIMAKTSWQNQISEAMRTRDIFAGQKFEHRGRSFVYHLVPMREAVGKRYNVAILMEDVTERLALEEQLEHSERLAMMGQFAAGVAHEVNNPLSIVKGNLQYLMERIKEGADFSKRENVKELKGIIYTAEKEVSRCGDIVGKFLHLARRSDHKQKTSVNINHVVRHVLHLMERRLSLKKIAVKRDFASGIAAVRGNHDLLQQVVLNLVLNAEQAIARKGTISIKTWQERQKVCISVKDSGKGIPKELLRYIFNPFFTTKGHEAVGGAGLGLSVAHRIIEDHGGAISVRSAPKRGSTFTISLPPAKRK